MIERTEAEIMKNWKGDISKPVASICTMTYNLEKYVSEALDSLLMQETDFPFEMVIDDDCSSDRTVEIIKQYVEKFPNIINVNFRKKNVGMRMNFVKNMQRANGKYIALCDGDDYWTDPLKLQKQVDFLEKNDEYVLTHAPLEPLYEEGSTKRTFNWSNEDRDALELQKTFLGTGTCVACFRNIDILKDYPNEYHCSPLNDNFFWSLVGAYGKSKFLGDIKVTKYRQHAGGDYTTKSQKEKVLMHQQTFLALYVYYLRIGNIPLSEYFYKQSVEYSFVLYGRSFYVKMLSKSFMDQGIRFLKGMILKVLRVLKIR